MNQTTNKTAIQPFDDSDMSDAEFAAFMAHHNSGRGEADE